MPRIEVHMSMASILISLLLPAFAMAKPLPAGNLFQNDEPIQLTLKYDIGVVQDDKMNLRETGVPGTVLIGDKSLDVVVMPRGNGSFRCQQTQLKIDFSNAASSGTPFEGFQKIKLYTSGRCQENKTDPEINKTVLGNYLNYKLYEQVFPIHFKTRLVVISYIDAGGKFENYTQLAFFLEPEKHVETRLRLKKLEASDLQTLGKKIPELSDSENISLMHAFQFFIGNFDYGIPGFFAHTNGTTLTERNVLLLQNGDGKLEPLAYDFDFSRFNYYGPICNISWRFFTDNVLAKECSIPNLTKIYKEDFAKFHYQNEVIQNFPKLKLAFQQWRSVNQDYLNKLGTGFSDGLDIFLPTFESSIQP